MKKKSNKTCIAAAARSSANEAFKEAAKVREADIPNLVKPMATTKSKWFVIAGTLNGVRRSH
jgi:hypothetical protein